MRGSFRPPGHIQLSVETLSAMNSNNATDMRFERQVPVF